MPAVWIPPGSTRRLAAIDFSAQSRPLLQLRGRPRGEWSVTGGILFLKETRMSKNWFLRGLAPTGSDHSRRRPACRLSVETLEGRVLLSGDMVLRWHSALWTALRTSGLGGPVILRDAA